MIHSFSNLVEMKNKVTWQSLNFLKVSLSGEPLEPLSIEIGLLILSILKKTHKTVTSVSILVNI